MIFLRAFLLGGTLCLLLQLISEMAKLPPPKVLPGAFALGGLLAPLGVTAALGAWGGGGLFANIIGAGDATFTAVTMALAGDFLFLILLPLLFLTVFSLGIAAHYLNARLTVGRKNGKMPM